MTEETKNNTSRCYRDTNLWQFVKSVFLGNTSTFYLDVESIQISGCLNSWSSTGMSLTLYSLHYRNNNRGGGHTVGTPLCEKINLTNASKGAAITHSSIAGDYPKYLLIYTALWPAFALSGWLLDNLMTQQPFKSISSLEWWFMSNQ